MNEEQLLVQSLRAIPRSGMESAEGWITYVGRTCLCKSYLLSIAGTREAELIETMWYQLRYLRVSLPEAVADWIERRDRPPLLFQLYPHYLDRLARWLVWGDDEWIKTLPESEWDTRVRLVREALAHELNDNMYTNIGGGTGIPPGPVGHPLDQ